MRKKREGQDLYLDIGLGVTACVLISVNSLASASSPTTNTKPFNNSSAQPLSLSHTPSLTHAQTHTHLALTLSLPSLLCLCQPALVSLCRWLCLALVVSLPTPRQQVSSSSNYI